MNIGEILVHLLGGAGMEYGARSRQTQQAELQAKESELARAQERLLQGKDIGAQKEIEAARFKHTTSERKGAEVFTAGESGEERALTEKIEGQRDATRRFEADLDATTRRYVADTGAETSRYGTDVASETARRGEGLEAILANLHLDATLATATDKLGSDAIKTLMDRNRSAIYSYLQEAGYTPEEISTTWDYVAGSWEDTTFSVPKTDEEAELRYMFREEYVDKTKVMPPSEGEYREHMWINLHIMAEVLGFPDTMSFAAQMYRKQFGESIEEGIDKLATGADEEERGPGFFEAESPMAIAVSPMAFPYSLVASGAELFYGRKGAANRQLDVWRALGMGYAPSTYLAATARAKREGWKRTALQVLKEDYVPYTSMPRTKKVPAATPTAPDSTTVKLLGG